MEGGRVRLELSTAEKTSSALAMEVGESAGVMIGRVIAENPVVIFSSPCCCMCQVMKNLLHTVGVHPTVIALDDEHEMSAVVPYCGSASESPTLFIGGDHVGCLDSLVALHLSGQLVPKLVQAGALHLNLPSYNYAHGCQSDPDPDPDQPQPLFSLSPH